MKTTVMLWVNPRWPILVPTPPMKSTPSPSKVYAWGTSAVAHLSLPQGHASPHMVLVYTIPNKIHAILHTKVDFRPFWGCFFAISEKIHATSQYYVPVLRSYPNLGGSALWHLFISQTVGPYSPFWAILGVFFAISEKIMQPPNIMCPFWGATQLRGSVLWHLFISRTVGI